MATKDFKDSELSCNHCGKSKQNQHLQCLLQFIRTHFDSIVDITSGYRCTTHNTKVGGAKNSYHKKGYAADIVVRGISPKEVYAFLCKMFPDGYGFILYDNFVHIDVRNRKYRKVM